MCPTRWTVKADSMNSIINNYGVLQDLWEVAVAVVCDTEVIARVKVVLSPRCRPSIFFLTCCGRNFVSSL